MAIRIDLPSGQSVILDEFTGNIVSALPSNDPPGLPPPPADEPAPSTARTVAPPRASAPRAYAAPAGITPTAAAQIAYQREQDTQQAFAQQSALAEQQRQYDESFGMNKAKYNQDFAENSRQFDTQFGENQRQFNANQDLTKGNTLLGLGSRPDTLIKYLYALRGQQVPQGFENTTQNLPGYQNVLGTGSQTTAPVAAQSAQAARPAPTITPDTVTAAQPGQVFQNIPTNANVAIVNGTPISLANGMSVADFASRLAPGGASPAAQVASTYNSNADPNAGTMYAGASGFNPNGTLRLSPNDPDAAGLMAKYPGRYTVGYDAGGVIPEPVMGIGLRSGQTYTFGEKGPEEISPAEKPYENSGTGSFAYGGTIGYDPLMGAGLADRTTADWASKGWTLAPMGPQTAPTVAPPPPFQQPVQQQPVFQQPTPQPTQPQPVFQRPAQLPQAPTAPGNVFRPQVQYDPATPYRGGYENGQWREGAGVGPKAAPTAPGQPTQSFAPPSLFNPPGLAGNISGPINPNGNPNFPQFSHFTGGGSSLIPSAQRLNNSLGSERSLYSGFLQDEAGVVPEDIWEMVRKLSPRVSGLRTPSFAS